MCFKAPGKYWRKGGAPLNVGQLPTRRFEALRHGSISSSIVNTLHKDTWTLFAKGSTFPPMSKGQRSYLVGVGQPLQQHLGLAHAPVLAVPAADPVVLLGGRGAGDDRGRPAVAGTGRHAAGGQ